MHAYGSLKGKQDVKLTTYFQEKVSSAFLSLALLQEHELLQVSSFFH